ncbi:MAG: hypothetical protein KC620_01680 [Myxococcales bacterium]|nr:hypothetical protein [Myxococcales bacterium]
MAAPTLDETAAALAAAQARDPERLRPALRAAMALVRRRCSPAMVDKAIADLFSALIESGPAALEGGDPQTIEDALLARRPETPLTEEALRGAWLAIIDDLARSGDKPPFGGSGGAESWAFTARSRPWPFVDVNGDVAKVASLYGGPQRLVVVRGPGRSSFLAAVRRALLGAHGVAALVPPVVPAARDDLGGLLKPWVERAPLPDELKGALDKLRYPEDLLGVLGRGGERTPVALLLDDAHLQGRAALVGLPLFAEPSRDRKALLVLAGPDDPADDGPLAELIADARDRDAVVEIVLPAFGENVAEALLSARFGQAPREVVAALTACVASEAGARALAVAAAWVEALADGADLASDAAAQLKAGLDVDAALPASAFARDALGVAALEGDRFHGFALGKVLGQDEDWVEDLLHDDEFAVDGEEVGGCEAAVPSEERQWTDLADGLHPVFRFADARLAASLAAGLSPERRASAAKGLRDALLAGYGPAGAWQVADRLWALTLLAGRDAQMQQWLLQSRDAARIEAGFRRMLPILGAQQPYRLALSRLYGAAMEAGGLGTMTGRVQLADQAFQAAATAAQRLGRPGPAGEALARLGEVRLALALPQPATQALELAEQLMERAGHERSLARIALLRAEVKVLEGELEAATGLLRSSIEQLRAQGDDGHVALGLVRLGRILYERGDIEAGVFALDEALRAADASGDPRGAGAARIARAFVHAEQDELDPAFQLLQQTVALFQRANMPLHILEVAAAGLQRRHGNAAEAEKRLRAIGDVFRKARAALQWADAWHGLAKCLIDQDHHTDAVKALEEVRTMRVRARDRFGLVRLYEDLGDAKAGQGDQAGALLAYGHARRLSERLGLVRRLGALDARLARLAAAVDADPAIDTTALRAQADDEIDAMEAMWRAPPQPVQQSEEVH